MVIIEVVVAVGHDLEVVVGVCDLAQRGIRNKGEISL
jgi:hypothetical protein